MTCGTVSQWDPFTVVNVLFFLNVCVGFWVVGLLQRSFWLIDPYWSIIPPLIAHFYRLHASTLATVSARGDLMLIIVWIWSIRLTHSYFRREEWKFGEREDWRYNKMATVDYPKSWPIMSFLLVGVCQVYIKLLELSDDDNCFTNQCIKKTTVTIPQSPYCLFLDAFLMDLWFRRSGRCWSASPPGRCAMATWV